MTHSTRSLFIAASVFLLPVVIGGMALAWQISRTTTTQTTSTEPVSFATGAPASAPAPDTPNTASPIDQPVDTTPVLALTPFVSTALPLQFSYPSDWQIWPDSGPRSTYVQLGDYLPADGDAELSRIPGHKLEVFVVDLPKDITLADWLTDDTVVDESGNPMELTVVEVAGIRGQQVVTNSSASASQAIYLPLGGKKNTVVSMALYGPETQPEELTELFNQLVATVALR